MRDCCDSLFFRWENTNRNPKIAPFFAYLLWVLAAYWHTRIYEYAKMAQKNISMCQIGASARYDVEIQSNHNGVGGIEAFIQCFPIQSKRYLKFMTDSVFDSAESFASL